MKLGYKRLFIFEICIFLLLLVNSFINNIFTGFRLSIFLILVLVLFKYLFGFEKDRHRFVKDIILDEIIVLFIFFIIYYLFGILVGFVKTNYYTIDGFKKFVIPALSYIVLGEYLRYNLLTKSEGNNLLIITSVVLLICFDITNSVYFLRLTSNYNIFIFIATSLMPAIFSNIAYSYITYKSGFKPVLVVCLVMGLYSYLLPIVPDTSEYINSIILIVLPSFMGFRVYRAFEKISDKQLEREYLKNKKSLKPLIGLGIAVSVLVYFVSGYFKYWAVVIASGSMTGSINKGDIVIIEKVKDNYDQLEVGAVLAYEKNKKVIVHRIIDRISVDGHYYYTTKGDTNQNADNLLVDEKMVVGVVKYRLPYVGIPTVWFNEL